MSERETWEAAYSETTIEFYGKFWYVHLPEHSWSQIIVSVAPNDTKLEESIARRIAKLPELERRVAELEQQIERMNDKADESGSE